MSSNSTVFQLLRKNVLLNLSIVYRANGSFSFKGVFKEKVICQGGNSDIKFIMTIEKQVKTRCPGLSVDICGESEAGVTLVPSR